MKQLLSVFLLLLAFYTQQAQSINTDELFVAKPYLQIGRTPAPGSLDLLWHTPDINADWAVEQRNDPKASWTKAGIAASTRVAPAGIAAQRVYRAALTGLAPGSVFNYRVLRNGKQVFASEGIAPKSADQPYRMVVFGDIGAGTAAAKGMAGRAYMSKPDLVVVPGDIIYEHGLVSEYKTNFWPVYNADKADSAGAPIMRSVPFVAAPGNHDTEDSDLNKYPDGLAYFLFWDQPLNGPAAGAALVPTLRGSDINRKAFTDAAGDAYPGMTNYSFNYGNAHLIILDANNYVDWTNKALRDWVANDLAAAKDATWRFVVFHQPGFNSSRKHFEQQQMRLLSPVFEAGRVDMVFSGHVHNYQRTFPLRFTPDKQSIALTGRDGRTPAGRLVTGSWKLDKQFDGKTNTMPQGIIYVITGAGGQDLYNPEQNDDADSWQKFTDKFISNAHSLTVAEISGRSLVIRQVDAAGNELDSFKITK